jgi:hypothetical protein
MSHFTRWYNVQDVHRDKMMKDTLSSYRGRIARSHAMHARHIDIPQPLCGRPTRVTLLTWEGVTALYDPAETLPKLTPYAVPMRLTDKARRHIIEAGLFTTGGLEKPARVLDREQFIAFLVSVGNEDLIEPDFINL